MKGKRIKVLVCLLPVLMSGCIDGGEDLADDRVNNDPSLTFVMTKSLEEIIANTQVYLFDGTGNEDPGEFRQKVTGVTYGTDRLSMSIAEGMWDVMLVGANEDISGKLIQPVRGSARSGKMWETRPVNNTLPSIPELRTAYVANNEVIADQNNLAQETALLMRNAALVKVVVVEAGGLDINGTHKIEITNVPTTLNWEGKLFPNKDNPTRNDGSNPMAGYFEIADDVDGNQKSNELSFIIPAHKGNDWMNSAPVDTTTCKLRLSVDMECEGDDVANYVKTDVEVPRVPRVNETLLIKLHLGSQLEVSSEILEWEDTELGVDLSQTVLYTDKASVGLSSKDTVYVNTNASGFTVNKEPGANSNWFNANVSGNEIRIDANVNTYPGVPRTSYITVTANNVTKKIPVTQRPDEGTISVSNKRLVFCPVTHETRMATVTSTGGDWEFVSQTYKATPNVQQGSNGANVTFTRGSTTKDDEFGKFYGDSILVVRNRQTLDTDTIEIVNCFIYMYENTINANAPTGTAQSAVTVSEDIEVYGGSRDLMNFNPAQNWIYGILWDASTQKMTLITDRAPDDEARSGSMSFVHAECPDYIINAVVNQDIIITIPPFDYFVVKFTWTSSDVDIAVEFAGNHVSGNGSNHPDYDKIPVGFGMQNVNSGKGVTGSGGGVGQGRVSFAYRNQTLLEWGGDATSGQGETAFFNAPVFEGDSNSPRMIKLEVYSVWWSSLPAANRRNMTFSMSAYQGGWMERGTNASGNNNRYNFYNIDGRSLYNESYSVLIDMAAASPTSYMTRFKHVATITYDRIKHSAKIAVHATITATGAEIRSLDQVTDTVAYEEGRNGIGKK